MYSRKEKLKNFNRLAEAKYGAVDLELLEDECPSHKDLAKFVRDPKRYANEILYALLDVCTVEDIKENRAYYERMMQDADALGAQAVARQVDIEDEGSTEKPVVDGSSKTSTDESEDELAEGTTASPGETAEPPASDTPPEDAKKK